VQDVHIVFLGTSSGTPSRERNVSSLAVVMDGATLLFDCGEGTQHRILQSEHVRLGAIDAVFISHVHGDHTYGLPGLLATMSMNNRRRPLDVYGPDGVREYLTSALALTQHHPIFDIRFPPLPRRADGYTVTALPLEHVIECFGFCVIEDDRPGKFDAAKARALGIPPGPIYGELQRSGDPRVCGPARRGRRIAFCTDTRPCANAIELARGADVLIHESTYGSELEREAHERFHSTAAQAARIAAEARARKLILTHFSTRYGEVAPLVEEACAIFPDTAAAADLACHTVAPPL
jgi:ribonuclease Z